jgi:hypothetical protein
MPITFVQFLQLFDPYLSLFGRRLIFFIRHMNTQSTRMQKICNLVFVIMHFQALLIQNHF